MYKNLILACSLLFTSLLFSPQLQAQDGMLGEVRMFAGNFAPRGWAFCDGQQLSISQHSALFSILGTIYGGDGRTTFALPDLRGRAAIGAGQGPGLSNHKQGNRIGQENLQSTKTTVVPGGGRSSKSIDVPTPNSSNMQPSLAIRYIICLQGVFPSRN